MGRKGEELAEVQSDGVIFSRGTGPLEGEMKRNKINKLGDDESYDVDGKWLGHKQVD